MAGASRVYIPLCLSILLNLHRDKQLRLHNPNLIRFGKVSIVGIRSTRVRDILFLIIGIFEHPSSIRLPNFGFGQQFGSRFFGGFEVRLTFIVVTLIIKVLIEPWPIVALDRAAPVFVEVVTTVGANVMVTCPPILSPTWITDALLLELNRLLLAFSLILIDGVGWLAVEPPSSIIGLLFQDFYLFFKMIIVALASVKSLIQELDLFSKLLY